MQKNNAVPLAERMRPENLEDFFGQNELVGERAFLRQALKGDFLPSLILWGPPGSGKTTLAHIVANETKSFFFTISAVSSGVKELRKIIEEARENKKKDRNTIVFVDEIHRWNKSQQDALLPFVESGILTLIGATTENPSFEINSALLSRARVLVLKKLEASELTKILKRALSDQKNGLGKQKIGISEKIIQSIAMLSNGDARTALNVLEACAKLGSEITQETVRSVLQKSHLFYDKNGEEHYNIISALHKSMRGGDANASVYWLARMLEGGEDPLYVARRLVRFAAEDVGLADNFALVLANNVFEACHKLGMPECNVHLAQCVIYLAQAPKSIMAYQACSRAKQDVERWGNLPVPHHIRNAPTKLMEKLGYGKGYRYTPLEDSSGQEYLPPELRSRKYI